MNLFLWRVLGFLGWMGLPKRAATVGKLGLITGIVPAGMYLPEAILTSLRKDRPKINLVYRFWQKVFRSPWCWHWSTKDDQQNGRDPTIFHCLSNREHFLARIIQQSKLTNKNGAPQKLLKCIPPTNRTYASGYFTCSCVEKCSWPDRFLSLVLFMENSCNWLHFLTIACFWLPGGTRTGTVYIRNTAIPAFQFHFNFSLI